MQKQNKMKTAFIKNIFKVLNCPAHKKRPLHTDNIIASNEKKTKKLKSSVNKGAIKLKKSQSNQNRAWYWTDLGKQVDSEGQETQQ